MGVMDDTLMAIRNAVVAFLESSSCDALLSMAYLFLTWNALRIARARLWPWAQRFLAVYFLCTSAHGQLLSNKAAQFLIFLLRLSTHGGLTTHKHVEKALWVLWAFNHVDTLAGALLWKPWMTRRTEIMLKRKPMCPSLVVFFPLIDLVVYPMLVLFSPRGLAMYLKSAPVQPHLCLMNMVVFCCLMAVKLYRSSPEERNAVEQEYQEDPKHLELQYAIQISLTIFQTRTFWHCVVTNLVDYIQIWYLPPIIALFDIFTTYVWFAESKKVLKKRDQESEVLDSCLGIDEKRGGRLETA